MANQVELRSEKRERLFQLLAVRKELEKSPYILDIFIEQTKASMEVEDIRQVETQLQ